MKKLKIFKIVLFSILALILLVVSGAALYVFSLMKPVDSVEKERTVRIEVPSGATVRGVSSKLFENKLVKSEDFFYLLAKYSDRILKQPFVLKSGVYTVKSSMKPSEILVLLSSGKQEYIKAMIPEGLTIRKIAGIIGGLGLCSKEDFISAANSPALLEKYNVPANTFEGFLFPDTYFFTTGMTADEIVSMMVENFFKHIDGIQNFSGKTVADIYESVVLASIVEREYRVDEEAPNIASVFKNRINIGMGLYSCATIEYIITEIQGKPHPDIITYEDLKIDSPYNTYKWAALPPTPISNPGMVALNAVADTPSTKYLYFTLTDSQAGTHKFSTSFESHVKAGNTFRTKKAAGSN